MGENTQQPDLGGTGAQPPNPPFEADTSGDIAAVRGPGRRGDKLEKAECPECHKMITKKNLKSHRRERHGVYERSPRTPETRKAMDTNKTDTPAKEKPLTTDEIVAVVVQMRWPHHMPSNKMPALLEWRAATERFLNG